MSEQAKKADNLTRIIAKSLDFVIIVAVADIIPRAGYIAGLAYLLIADGLFDGQSLGKKLLKLRVISSESGTACEVRESVIRNSPLAAGYLLWFMIPWVGWVFLFISATFEFILILGSKDGKRLGDEIAKTVVLED